MIKAQTPPPSLYHHLNCIWLRFYFWLKDVDNEKQQGFLCGLCGRGYPTSKKLQEWVKRRNERHNLLKED
jgi:hypothetical protein